MKINKSLNNFHSQHAQLTVISHSHNYVWIFVHIIFAQLYKSNYKLKTNLIFMYGMLCMKYNQHSTTGLVYCVQM